VIELIYLACAVAFIIGLKRMSGPRTARSGNLIAGIGMAVAVVVVLIDEQILNWDTIVAGLLVGTVIGAWAALRVRMTAMPQMVAAFNDLAGHVTQVVDHILQKAEEGESGSAR